MTRVVAICSMAAGLVAMAGCSATAPSVPPPAAMAAPPVPAAAGNTKVGAGSKAGFCTFKDATGKLYEAKC